MPPVTALLARFTYVSFCRFGLTFWRTQPLNRMLVGDDESDTVTAQVFSGQAVGEVARGAQRRLSHRRPCLADESLSGASPPGFAPQITPYARTPVNGSGRR